MQTRPLPAVPQGGLVDTIATAESLEAGLRAVGALLLQEGALAGVEWWIPGDGGSSFRLAFSTGDATGARTAIPLGPAGALVLAGERHAELERDIARLRPLLRRRWIEEQLATHATHLRERTKPSKTSRPRRARREIVTGVRPEKRRAPRGMTRAIELVDSILEAVRVDQDGRAASVADCVQRLLPTSEPSTPTSSRAPPAHFPSSAALRLVLRNLLANALAAGAHRIHVSALAHGERRASSSTTTASASDRPTATPPALSSASLSAAGSPIASEARSSSSPAPSAEPAP
jgi:signal transduction histidine kinase